MESVAKLAETNARDLEVMVEDELSRLQRQYRIMESDRIAYVENIKHNMGKQNDIIHNLKTEENSLILTLQVANSKQNKRKDEIVILQLKQLLDNHRLLLDKIKIRKTYVTELDYEIRKVQKQMMTIRFELGTMEVSRHERIAWEENNVIKLENKLETSNNRYGVVISQNKRLRQEIDHLLIERQLFNKNWRLLSLHLESSKKFMLDLIDQATMAYDQREEWCQKLDALKHRAYTDLQYHSEEMRVLQHTLDHDVDLQNFLYVKGQRRITRSILKRELMKREQNKIRLKEQTEKYSNILHDIREFAGSENVNQLASQFVKQEEENFALFNYIHELNYELESLGDSIRAIQLKIDEQKHTLLTRSAKQHANTEQLQFILTETTNMADLQQKRCMDLNGTLLSVFGGIGRIFQKIKCDKAPILDLLGQTNVVEERAATCTRKVRTWKCDVDMDVAEVVIEDGKGSVMNAHNIQLYLGVLENTINEKMKMIFYMRSKKKKNTIILRNVHQAPEKAKVESINSPCPICYASVLLTRTDIVTVAMSLNKIRRLLRNYTHDDCKMIHSLLTCDLPQIMGSQNNM